ncbi:MAG: hypothetical protein HYY97_09030 [Rhodocyclales bacterium]|nr:hypothetical protein [Rhodocyclales bacterium]
MTRVGLCFASVQFLFVTCWTVYVIYLPGLRRIGPWLLGATVVSGLAFLLLPIVGPAGSPVLLLGAVAVSAVTSSALRAPPMMMLGNYVPAPGRTLGGHADAGRHGRRRRDRALPDGQPPVRAAWLIGTISAAGIGRANR